MSKQNWILLCLMCIYSIGYSQTLKKQTLASKGSSHFVYANNKSYFLQESIGQGSVINTYNTTNNSLRQGFLQPISATIISEYIDDTLNGFIYPNPFNDYINIRFDEPVYDSITITMYDALGRLVFSQEYSPIQLLVVNFNTISSGSYLLRIQMRSEVLVAKLVRR